MAYKRKKGKSGFKRRGKRGYGGKKTFYKKKAYGRTKTYGGPRQNKIEVSVPAYNEFAALPGSVWGQFDLATQDYGGSPLNQLARKINTLISKSMELAPDQPITNLSPGFAGAIGAFAASARLAEAAVNAEAIRRPHTNAALGITQISRDSHGSSECGVVPQDSIRECRFLTYSRLDICPQIVGYTNWLW